MAYFAGFIATPTKIHNFLECPRKYFFYHVNHETKRLSPEKPYFTLGHNIHAVLRDFFALEPYDRSEELLLKSFEDVWLTRSGAAAGFKTMEEEEQFKERGREMLRRFLAMENWKMKPHYLPEKEGDFPGYLQVPVEGGLAFGGIVDRIDEEPDGSLHIIDYKTGKSDEPDEWQLPMYAVMIGRAYGRAVAKTSYVMLEYGTHHTTEVTIEGNLEILRRVKEVVEKIPRSKVMEDFVCRMGENCRHCNYLLELGFDPKTGKRIEKDGEEVEVKGQAGLFSNDLPF